MLFMTTDGADSGGSGARYPGWTGRQTKPPRGVRAVGVGLRREASEAKEPKDVMLFIEASRSISWSFLSEGKGERATTGTRWASRGVISGSGEGSYRDDLGDKPLGVSVRPDSSGRLRSCTAVALCGCGVLGVRDGCTLVVSDR